MCKKFLIKRVLIFLFCFSSFSFGEKELKEAKVPHSENPSQKHSSSDSLENTDWAKELAGVPEPESVKPAHLPADPEHKASLEEKGSGLLAFFLTASLLLVVFFLFL